MRFTVGMDRLGNGDEMDSVNIGFAAQAANARPVIKKLAQLLKEGE